MDFRLKWTGAVAGAVFIGLVAGHDTVAAMDPLPIVIPARPISPYRAPQTVPADILAYPVSVPVPMTPYGGARPYDAVYSPNRPQSFRPPEPEIAAEEDAFAADGRSSALIEPAVEMVEPAASAQTEEQ